MVVLVVVGDQVANHAAAHLQRRSDTRMGVGRVDKSMVGLSDCRLHRQAPRSYLSHRDALPHDARQFRVPCASGDREPVAFRLKQ